jgi:tRNA(His) 5'-end guanylyltransferase
MSEDSLGDRQKEYEAVEAGRRLMPLIPALARIDGRSFSSFTQGMERPYDVRMTRAMQETTRYLVAQTNALMGYCQSDEISLVWYEGDRRSQIFFSARIQKMTSSLAAMASVFFNSYIRDNLPEKWWKKLPTFDCRVWSVPTLEEAANAFLWREWDAHKNSVSMAARHYYSHSELENKHSGEMQEMLFKKGINYHDYPAFFRSGTFFQRRIVKRKFDYSLDSDLPEKHAARTNPDLVFERQEIREMEMPRFSRVLNRVDVIFNGADPETGELSDRDREQRLQALRYHFGLSDEEMIRQFEAGILVDPREPDGGPGPHAAEWLILIGRGDLLV